MTTIYDSLRHGKAHARRADGWSVDRWPGVRLTAPIPLELVLIDDRAVRNSTRAVLPSLPANDISLLLLR